MGSNLTSPNMISSKRGQVFWSCSGCRRGYSRWKQSSCHHRHENPRRQRRTTEISVTYLTKFVLGYSQIACPLRELLKETVVWSWTSVHEDSFRQLQDMVTNTPVLSFYSQTAPTIVSADASSHGTGGVLLQVQEDDRRAPIRYVSRALTSTEKISLLPFWPRHTLSN